MPTPLSALPTRAARWSATHPWRAIGAWLAFVVLAVCVAVAVPTNEADDADYRVGESGRAAEMIEEAGLEEAPSDRSSNAAEEAAAPAEERSPGC